MAGARRSDHAATALPAAARRRSAATLGAIVTKTGAAPGVAENRKKFGFFRENRRASDEIGRNRLIFGSNAQNPAPPGAPRPAGRARRFDRP